jgi:hypothetical protein
MHRFRIGKKDHGIYGMAAAGQTVEIYRVDVDAVVLFPDSEAMHVPVGFD